MELRLLGPVEVRLDDRSIELGPRKQRAVLTMLALRAGRTVSADRLIEGLWGDEPPASAGKMVQLYVSHLRPLLEGSGARIVTRAGGYELQLSGDEVDVVRFERLVNDSRARGALALWRGDEKPAAESGAAWAAADRRVTNLAAVVPLTNRRSVVLVSKRVGNVQTHSQWFHPARSDVGALSLESFQNWNQ